LIDINQIWENRSRSLWEETFARLDQHHVESCPEYAKINHHLGSFHPLPVRLFKQYDLRSVPESEITKTMYSSGTTGSQSKIFLDKTTAKLQAKALNKIVSSYIGNKRMPMLIIDSPKSLEYNTAATAGILGFSPFGKDITYALGFDSIMKYDTIIEFHRRYMGESIIIFGLTYNIFQFLPLLEGLRSSYGKDITFENAILVHGGGWKKLEKYFVDNNAFKKRWEDHLHITKIHNYYGMIEQTGSIFMECEKGYLHCSPFSDVFTKRTDMTNCNYGESGILRLMSLLPYSYPGHNILTEDIGTIYGDGNCLCGRPGKFFHIHGRIPNAEIRGCGNATH